MTKKLLSAFFLALAIACNPGVNPGPDTTSKDPETFSADPADSADPSDEPVPSTPAEIFDVSGKLIAEIDARSSCSAIEAGIFCSEFALGENQSTAPAVYRIQLVDQNKYVAKKTVEGQGYECTYARTELDGSVYTLILIGNPFDNEPDKLMLYGFHPSTNTISHGVVTHNGFPYAAMTRAGDRLLIMSHEMGDPKCDKIFSFDGSMIKEVLAFPSGEESLRSLCGTDDGGFYLLRLHLDGTGDNELFVDRYDRNFNKVSEKSVKSLLAKAGAQNGLTAQDAAGEQGHHVSGFRVVGDRYMFYENFSTIRAIIDMKEDKVLFAGNDMYQLSTGSGRPVFYRLQFSESDEADILDFKDGVIKHVPLTPSDPDLLAKNFPITPGHLLQGVSLTPSGCCLLRFSSPTGTTRYLWTAF